VTFKNGLYAPIAWMRLSRDQDVESRPYSVSDFILKGGILSTKGRTNEIAECNFEEWPELGRVVEGIWLESAGHQTENLGARLGEKVTHRVLVKYQ
jgi:hypothetical protein